MTGPLRQAAADPGTPLTGPVPGTGTGTRPGGPLAAPVWAATEQLIPITEAEAMAPGLLCGHLPGEGCDDDCAYWRYVALGELPGPDAYLVDGVHTLPSHAPGLAPLVDPALLGRAA